MRLDKHPIIKKCYDVMQAIEVCGASIELTHAGTLAGELGEDIDKLVDQLQYQESINNLEKLQITKDDVLIFKCKFTAHNRDQLVEMLKVIPSQLGFSPLILVIDNDFNFETMPIEEFHRVMKTIEKTRGICNENSTEIEKDNP